MKDTFLTGFSPRKGNLTLYFMAGFFEQIEPLLKKLGKCKISKGCMYIKNLDDVDLGVLCELIQANVKRLANMPKPQPKKRRRNATAKNGVVSNGNVTAARTGLD
jgi:hypothetical protein